MFTALGCASRAPVLRGHNEASVGMQVSLAVFFLSHGCCNSACSLAYDNGSGTSCCVEHT